MHSWGNDISHFKETPALLFPFEKNAAVRFYGGSSCGCPENASPTVWGRRWGSLIFGTSYEQVPGYVPVTENVLARRPLAQQYSHYNDKMGSSEAGLPLFLLRPAQ